MGKLCHFLLSIICLLIQNVNFVQAGCVHVSHPSPHPSPHQQSDVKVIILLYSSEKKAYVGFVPIDQLSFVNKIKSVIQNARKTQVGKLHAMEARVNWQ